MRMTALDYKNECSLIDFWNAYFHAFFQIFLWVRLLQLMANPRILSRARSSDHHLPWCTVFELTPLCSSYYYRPRLSACKWGWFRLFSQLKMQNKSKRRIGDLPHIWQDIKMLSHFWCFKVSRISSGWSRRMGRSVAIWLLVAVWCDGGVGVDQNIIYFLNDFHTVKF